MDRHQPPPVGSDAFASRHGYRGPFTLGLSRLTGYRARNGFVSRRKAAAYLSLALGTSVITALWLLSGRTEFPGSWFVSHSIGRSSSTSIQSFLGVAGLLASLGLGLAGLWYWPFNERISVQPREESLAAYDHVTGLPTLRLFTVLLGQALTRASHMGRNVGVLVAELHQFRPLPTSMGTPNLSLIARVQAARIKSALSPKHTVARIGARRFAILIEEVVTRDDMDIPAQNIYRTMSLPLMIEGQEVFLTCQIGGATSSSVPSGGTLLSQAIQSLACATSEHPVRLAVSIGESSSSHRSSDSTSAIESLHR